MGLINLNIIFDNPQNIYFCGQTVSGRLLVNTDSPKKLRSIVIKFKGEAECHWSETRTVRRNGRNHTHTVHYRGHELYFDNRVKLFGGSGDTETLPPGEHSFQFSMILPIHLPSSFEGSHGFVRYTVKAILDRPWKFDHEVKNAFTVLSHLDLNLDPRNREPFKVEDSKHFCCCCCKSGPLTLVTVIPARGFVPGQSIPLTVEVDNASNVNIYEVVCELQKIVTYHSTSPQRKIKKDHVDVCRMNLDGSVAEGDSKTWAAKMNIPALPPSGLLKCSIIDIEYLLKVKAKPEGPHMDLKNNIPVILGTIPLWQAPAAPAGMPFPNMPPPTAPPPGMGAEFLPDPNMGANFSATAPPYPDMPPPTYEECIFGTSSIGDSEDSQHVFGISGYNPRYPTYTLQAVPPPYSEGSCAPPKY
ncbi:arrestin domain-containing protein 17-like isoform X1 [Periplaneta americana]|uniref:arrestin domain-containing protein 17-like isoform X1 n=1 Tax=Periplaneta americana TaxID=6978 RepID=UPI0037E90374